MHSLVMLGFAVFLFVGLPGPVMFYEVKKFFEWCFPPDKAFAATITSFCLVLLVGVMLVILFRALVAKNPLVFSATSVSYGEKRKNDNTTLFTDVVFSSDQRTLRVKLLSSVWPSFDKAFETGLSVDVGIMFGWFRDVPELVAVCGSHMRKRNDARARLLYKKTRVRIILLLFPLLVILPLATSYMVRTVLMLNGTIAPITFLEVLYDVAQSVGELHSGGAIMVFTGLFFYGWAGIFVVWWVRMRKRFERMTAATQKSEI